MTVTNSKAKAMGAFLKSRRERLSPEDAGLEFASGQRKTPGLRREEVSLLAGVSVTYYTWLEQGRDLTPSKDVIDSIAEALNYLQPRRVIYISSGTRMHSRRLCGPSRRRSAYAEDYRSIDIPSHITNERSEVLAWNKATQETFTDFASIPVQDRYFMRLLFEDTEMRNRIVNIEEFSRYSVGVFRTYYDKHRDDPWFETAVEHLTQNSPEFDRLWGQYDVQLKRSTGLFCDPGTLQPVAYDIHSLVNLSDRPDIHICIYTPVTEDPGSDR